MEIEEYESASIPKEVVDEFKEVDNLVLFVEDAGKRKLIKIKKCYSANMTREEFEQVARSHEDRL